MEQGTRANTLSTMDDGTGPARPAAVLWDMDGTLVDSEKIWDIPLYELAERLGGQLSLATREAMVGSNMANTMLMLFAELNLAPEPTALAEAAQWLTARTAELFAQGLPWRPGALEALRMVRAAGLPTALVTSTERALTEVALDSIGREFFDITICGDEVDGQNKPKPGPYLKAARLLGVDPRDCIAIEDSPTGSASAQAAGCTVIAVPCDVPLTAGERLIVRDSLIGLDLAELTALLHSS